MILQSALRGNTREASLPLLKGLICTIFKHYNSLRPMKHKRLLPPFDLPTHKPKILIRKKREWVEIDLNRSISRNIRFTRTQKIPTHRCDMKASSAALALSSMLLESKALPTAVDISGHTCKESKQFTKREKQQKKKLVSSMMLNTLDSAPTRAIDCREDKSNYGKPPSPSMATENREHQPLPCENLEKKKTERERDKGMILYDLARFLSKISLTIWDLGFSLASKSLLHTTPNSD